MSLSQLLIAAHAYDETKKEQNSLKRFLLFAYMGYDAGGGMNDLQGSFETQENAEAVFLKKHIEEGWNEGHVFDLQTGKITKIK